MAKFDYNKSLSTANRLLDKFGSIVFIETPDSTLHKGYGVFSNYTTQTRPSNLTEENAIEFFLAADIDHTPVLGDYLLSGTDVWIVTQVDFIQPGGDLLLYKLGLKL